MAEAAPSQPPPREKAPPPALRARWPRPGAVRLRRSAVLLVGGAAGAVLAGALAWAFVLQPQRGAVPPARSDAPGAPAPVRPAEVVASQPGSYARSPAAALPPPRLGLSAPPTPDGRRRAVRASASAAPSGRARLAREAAASGLFFASASVTAYAAPAASPPAEGAATAGAEVAAAYNAHRLLAPLSPFELKAGAILPAVLLTAIDTSRPGPVVASVTDDVFDTTTGQHLLVPQGARLVGRHRGDTAYGERRAIVTWQRLILPNGKSLLLGDEPAVDAEGAVGLPGRVERRLGALAVASLFAGAITTLGTVAREADPDRAGGWLGDVGDAAAIEGAQAGGRLIDRELQVHPVVRLGAGAAVRVLITKDIVLEPYQP